MLTLPIFDFQSNRAPLCPSRHSLKVRVQGSRVLCAHSPALFTPNQPPVSLSLPFFFSSCARVEGCTTKVMDMDFLWFDSMKRSDEGTTKWQWGLHIALTGTRVLASPWKWHRPESLWGRPHQNQEGPVSPHDLVWSPCGFSVPSAACRKEQRNNLGCKVCHMSCGAKLF